MFMNLVERMGVMKQHLTIKQLGVEMLDYVIGGLILLLAVIAWISLKTNWFDARRKPVYVCDRCNENHCECTQE